MATKRYYPSPDLDMAVYYLQNNPAARTVDPKRLQNIPIANGRTIGRNAWARAKKALANTSEERNQVCFDTKTLLTAYIGEHTRIVTRAKSRASFLKRIEMVQVVGHMKHVYTSPDKRFYIYERPPVCTGVVSMKKLTPEQQAIMDRLIKQNHPRTFGDIEVAKKMARKGLIVWEPTPWGSALIRLASQKEQQP